MEVIQTLLPVLLLIALGFALARIGFLNREAIGHLSRLVFWIALPSLIFRSLATAEMPIREVSSSILLNGAGVILVALMAWGIGLVRKSPGPVLGSMVQSAFRGNLAFVGLPVVTYWMGAEAIGGAVIVMGPMMVLFNLMAILALLGTQHRIGLAGLRLMAISLLKNPLIISSLAGLGWRFLHLPVPLPVDRVLESLGQVAVPLALMSIGSSFTTLSLSGRRTALWVAIGCKVAAAPLIGWGLCELFGIHGMDRRILLVFAACPTAAASFIMAREMGADAELSAASIAASTLLSFIPLSLILLYA